LALSAESGYKRYTYADLAGFPDDHFRREIIDGELIVTPSPIPRHQLAVADLVIRLGSYKGVAGGQVYPAPLDVFLADDNVVEPDVLFVRADHLEQVGDKYVKDAPDLVVEISSPSTRRLELVRKRELYERFSVPEYWYVDLDADRVEIYRLVEGAYAAPEFRFAGETLEAASLPGFSMPVDEALGIEPETQGQA
jgi:Uma2 family endonuclease